MHVGGKDLTHLRVTVGHKKPQKLAPNETSRATVPAATQKVSCDHCPTLPLHMGRAQCCLPSPGRTSGVLNWAPARSILGCAQRFGDLHPLSGQEVRSDRKSGMRHALPKHFIFTPHSLQLQDGWWNTSEAYCCTSFPLLAQGRGQVTKASEPGARVHVTL